MHSDNLVFFTPDIGDPGTIKRVQEFLDQGLSPVVFGFRRSRYDLKYQPDWPYVYLGRTTDGRYWRRLRAVLRAIPAIVTHRREVRRVRLFYCRNIDQLILAMLAAAWFNRRAAVAYEVLDIQPAFVGRGLAAAALRLVERLCLRRISILVLSSPGFHRNYYAAMQNYRGEWFLLENKLHRSVVDTVTPRQQVARADRRREGGYRWVVGYFGLIRGDATFDLMARLAERLEHKVQFKIRGVPTTVDQRRFFAELRRHPNMVFEGAYSSPGDLSALYREVDFAWALDLENVANNSRWLLPCRFYEAGLFGVPCLAVRGFELGRLVERLEVGWTFGDPMEATLARFFETLTASEYDKKCRRLSESPASAFVSDEDAAALCRRLVEHANAASRAAPPVRALGRPGRKRAVDHHAVELDEP